MGYGYRAITLETESLERHQGARTKCHLSADITDGAPWLQQLQLLPPIVSFIVPITSLLLIKTDNKQPSHLDLTSLPSALLLCWWFKK